MKELTLQELKEIELNILKMFDAFCKENSIRYYLSFGTLLGAIRYKKFIPWDDDVDVLVPREDYDRLIKLFRDDENYHLYAFEKDKRYLFPFAKLCDMRTRKEETFYKCKGIELGVEIDIFPLDAFDNDPEQAKREIKCIQKCGSKLRLVKLDKPATNNPVKRLVWSVIMGFYKMIGGAHYIQKIIKVSNNPSQKGNDFVGAKVWCMYGERDMIPREAFADTVDIEFEGEMFPAPVGYDTYLTCMYGDYLPEPPKEKQKSHHHFKAYRV